MSSGCNRSAISTPGAGSCISRYVAKIASASGVSLQQLLLVACCCCWPIARELDVDSCRTKQGQV
eukprot:SAG25_NODE_640_length_6239_cov_3.197557_5_plen_65_part_00